jgi:uncharacterized protein with FMN-binding domain
MQRGLVILVAVAILGLLGYHYKHSGDPHLNAQPSSASQYQPAQSQSTTATNSKPASYKDGTFTGDAADTPYGTVQVAAVISGGKITDINFLQLPNDQRESQQVSSYAQPYLKQAALSKQSAKIDFVSGATSTTYGFEESLQAALNQAAG